MGFYPFELDQKNHLQRVARGPQITQQPGCSFLLSRKSVVCLLPSGSVHSTQYSVAEDFLRESAKDYVCSQGHSFTSIWSSHQHIVVRIKLKGHTVVRTLTA